MCSTRGSSSQILFCCQNGIKSLLDIILIKDRDYWINKPAKSLHSVRDSCIYDVNGKIHAVRVKSDAKQAKNTCN